MSKREKLKRLVLKHPNWSNQQYADALGQNLNTIRGALSAMGLSRNKELRRRVQEKPIRVRVGPPRKESKPKVQPVPAMMGSGRINISVGYLKLS